jgi:hypothetical protein
MQMHARVCRLYQRGECLLGGQCPLQHTALQTADGSLDSTRLPASDCSSAKGSENGTSNSGGHSWADMSEELWRITAPAPQAPQQPGDFVGGRLGQPRGLPEHLEDGLPSFSDRVASIPEFLPSEAARAPPHAPRDDAQDRAPKSKTAIRRRQRKMTERWTVMRELNGATSMPVAEALQGMPPDCQLPPASLRPRIGSASPERPPAPPPTPRWQRRRDDHDQDDSGDDGPVESTKVSL